MVSSLARSEFGRGARLPRGVGLLPVRADDPAPPGPADVEHGLHDLPLVAPCRQPHAVALPVGPGPFGLFRQSKAGYSRQQLSVALGDGAAPDDQLRQSWELYPTYGSLNVSDLRPGAQVDRLTRNARRRYGGEYAGGGVADVREFARLFAVAEHRQRPTREAPQHEPRITSPLSPS
jgi:hypothetical protein